MAIYEVDVKNFDKMQKLIVALNKSFDSLKKVNNETKKMENVNSSVKKANKSFGDFNNSLSKINSSIYKTLGLEEVFEHFDKIKKFGVGMFKSLIGGTLGFIKTIGLLFVKLSAVMIIVAALTAAVQFFKSAFKFNIGNIQGTFRKLQAQFKILMVTIQKLFLNYLAKLAPLFEQIGAALEEVMAVLTSKEVMDAFMTLAEVFGNLMKIVLPALLWLLKAIAKWIQLLAKGINSIMGAFGVNGGSSSTTNNNSNDNRIINYYTSGSGNQSATYGSNGQELAKQLNRIP